MSASRTRRYIVTGNGITAHAPTLEEAIAAFRAQTRRDAPPDWDPARVEELVEASEEPLPAA